MAGLKLTVDSRELTQKLKQVDHVVRTEAKLRGLHAGANFLIGHIKLNIVNRGLVDTGNMLGSVQEDEVMIYEDGGSISFGPHTVYAAIHEFGGTIRPTNGPFLVFEGADGELVFTRSVHIPARPYIRPAIEQHGQEATELVGSTIGSIIDGAWAK